MQKPSNSEDSPFDSSDLALKFACTLQTMNVEQRFQQKNIEFMERFFVETFMEMDQRGCLKAQERSLTNLLIASHLAGHPPTPVQTESLAIKNEENQEDYFLISHSRENCDMAQNSRSFSIKIQSLHSQENTLQLFQSSKTSHQIFYDFFNIAMKKLHLYQLIKQFCLSIKVWTMESCGKKGLAFFVYKLIVIKNFYPNYFPAIMKQFTKMIQQFNRREGMTKVELYAKQVLSPRYLNCIRIYVETDDIAAAANQLYSSPKCHKDENRMKNFEDYQRQIKSQALETDIKKKQNNQKIQKFKKYLANFKFVKKQISKKQDQQFLPWTNQKSVKKKLPTNIEAELWAKEIGQRLIGKLEDRGPANRKKLIHRQSQASQIEQINSSIKKNTHITQPRPMQKPSNSEDSPFDSSDLALKFACTLQTMNVEQRFQQKNIEFMERFFVETFMEMDQRGCLKAQERPLTNLLIASHLAGHPPTPVQTESLAIKNEENQEDYFLIPEYSIQIDQDCQVSSQVHRKIFELLIDSMKRLRVYRQIRLFCMKEKAWSAKANITSFLQKLIAIKILLPQFFLGIICQLIDEIEQCDKTDPITAKDYYIKHILIPRYLNCVRIYVENDDIEAAASQVYTKSSKNIEKIHTFVEYQQQMKQKAVQIEIKKKNNQKRLRPRIQSNQDQYDLMENEEDINYP